MVVKKRKKVTRYRGSHTHGGGAKKKRRGAGHRGGRGNAGSGKRSDAKKPTYQKNYKNYFGKIGFKSKTRKKIVAINIDKLQKLIQEKGLSQKIDLNSLGYTKLLGTGKATAKLNITVKYASKQAVEKIKAAGGKVEVQSFSKDSKEGFDEKIDEKNVDEQD